MTGSPNRSKASAEAISLLAVSLLLFFFAYHEELERAQKFYAAMALFFLLLPGIYFTRFRYSFFSRG
jgi:hypothetical protein